MISNQRFLCVIYHSLKEMCAVSGFHRMHPTRSICCGSATVLNSWWPHLSALTRCGNNLHEVSRPNWPLSQRNLIFCDHKTTKKTSCGAWWLLSQLTHCGLKYSNEPSRGVWWPLSQLTWCGLNSSEPIKKTRWQSCHAIKS